MDIILAQTSDGDVTSVEQQYKTFPLQKYYYSTSCAGMMDSFGLNETSVFLARPAFSSLLLCLQKNPVSIVSKLITFLKEEPKNTKTKICDCLLLELVLGELEAILVLSVRRST